MKHGRWYDLGYWVCGCLNNKMNEARVKACWWCHDQRPRKGHLCKLVSDRDRRIEELEAELGEALKGVDAWEANMVVKAEAHAAEMQAQAKRAGDRADEVETALADEKVKREAAEGDCLRYCNLARELEGAKDMERMNAEAINRLVAERDSLAKFCAEERIRTKDLARTIDVQNGYACPQCKSIGHFKPGKHCLGVESGTTEDF